MDLTGRCELLRLQLESVAGDVGFPTEAVGRLAETERKESGAVFFIPQVEISA